MIIHEEMQPSKTTRQRSVRPPTVDVDKFIGGKRVGPRPLSLPALSAKNSPAIIASATRDFVWVVCRLSTVSGEFSSLGSSETTQAVPSWTD